jgi:hypothetical protein
MTRDDWWWIRALMALGLAWYLTDRIAGPMTDYFEALTP